MADDTLWNGLITFYSDNYLVLSVVCCIGCKDLRFGAEFTSTENACSLLAVSGMVLSIAFPVSVFILYRVKLRTLDRNHEDVKKIVKIVKSINEPKEAREERVKQLFLGDNLFVTMLKSEAHLSFMGSFGSLLEGLRIRYLGLTLTALTPVIDLLLQLLIAVSVTRLVNWPVFTIFVFNFAILFSAEFQIYFVP